MALEAGGVPVVVVAAVAVAAADAVATATAGLADPASVAVGGGGGSWWCSIFTGLDLNFISNVRPPTSDEEFCADLNYYYAIVVIRNSTIAYLRVF